MSNGEIKDTEGKPASPSKNDEVLLQDDDEGRTRRISKSSEEFTRNYVDYNHRSVEYVSSPFAGKVLEHQQFWIHYADGRTLEFGPLTLSIPSRKFDPGTNHTTGRFTHTQLTAGKYPEPAPKYIKRGGFIYPGLFPSDFTEITTPNLIDAATSVKFNHNQREQFLELAELTSSFASAISSSLGMSSTSQGLVKALRSNRGVSEAAKSTDNKAVKDRGKDSNGVRSKANPRVTKQKGAVTPTGKKAQKKSPRAGDLDRQLPAETGRVAEAHWSTYQGSPHNPGDKRGGRFATPYWGNVEPDFVPAVDKNHKQVFGTNRNYATAKGVPSVNDALLVADSKYLGVHDNDVRMITFSAVKRKQVMGMIWLSKHTKSKTFVFLGRPGQTIGKDIIDFANKFGVTVIINTHPLIR